MHIAFTTHHKRAHNRIITDSTIIIPSDYTECKVKGLWDTGATNSVISTNLVKSLNLPVTGIIDITGVNNVMNSNTYLIGIKLPNNIMFNDFITVSESSNLQGFDILIGMDIISQGDFAISHTSSGDITMSYVYPPHKHIDFCTLIPHKPKIGVNDPCPCNSGKKYKKCCGR